MGNSIQKKKKVQTDCNFSAPPSPSLTPSREKPKGFWLFGRPDKPKTGKRRAEYQGVSRHHCSFTVLCLKDWQLAKECFISICKIWLVLNVGKGLKLCVFVWSCVCVWISSYSKLFRCRVTIFPCWLHLSQLKAFLLIAQVCRKGCVYVGKSWWIG